MAVVHGPGIYNARPLLSVATGHFLWIIDTFAMIYNKSWDPMKTVFGIADYNSSSGQPEYATIITTSHHLWYMPLCVTYMRYRTLPLTNFHHYCSIFWICAVSAFTAFIGKR